MDKVLVLRKDRNLLSPSVMVTHVCSPYRVKEPTSHFIPILVKYLEPRGAGLPELLSLHQALIQYRERKHSFIFKE